MIKGIELAQKLVLNSAFFVVENCGNFEISLNDPEIDLEIIFNVEKEDLNKILNYHWVSRNGNDTPYYVDKGGKSILMSRFLLNAPKYKWVDHINGNKTDNSKSNLRNATASENNCNRRMRSDNTLGYKGIFFRKAKGGVYGWMIRLHGEAVSRSGFKTAEEAYIDRCKNLTRIHGEFANKG